MRKIYLIVFGAFLASLFSVNFSLAADFRCGWCGRQCTTIKNGMQCLAIAPPSNMECISELNGCVAVSSSEIIKKRPDLSVDGPIMVSPAKASVGEWVLVEFNMKNGGLTDATPAEYSYIDLAGGYTENGPNQTCVNGLTLKPGQSCTVSTQIKFATSGQKVLKVKLDSDNSVLETNENNNSYSINVNIYAPTPTVTPIPIVCKKGLVNMTLGSGCGQYGNYSNIKYTCADMSTGVKSGSCQTALAWKLVASKICEDKSSCVNVTPTLVPTATLTPTCIPRPACMDGIDDGSGRKVYCDPQPGIVFCPKEVTPTPTPSPESRGKLCSTDKDCLSGFKCIKMVQPCVQRSGCPEPKYGTCIATIIPTSTPVIELAGDANKDGIVDLIDFDMWKRVYFGKELTYKTNPEVDFDKNKKIDLDDYNVWKIAYLNLK